MKKYTLLLLSGSILTLAACGGNENTDTQAQIDSAANARSAAMEAQLKAKNDSLINAMAMMKADSAAKADSMSKEVAYQAGMSAGKASGKNAVKVTKSTTTTKPKNEETKVNDLFNTKKTSAEKAKEAKQEENKVNDLFK